MPYADCISDLGHPTLAQQGIVHIEQQSHHSCVHILNHRTSMISNTNILPFSPLPCILRTPKKQTRLQRNRGFTNTNSTGQWDHHRQVSQGRDHHPQDPTRPWDEAGGAMFPKPYVPSVARRSVLCSRTEGDGVVRLEVAPAGPESSAARLVVGVRVRVRAVVLCAQEGTRIKSSARIPTAIGWYTGHSLK